MHHSATLPRLAPCVLVAVALCAVARVEAVAPPPTTINSSNKHSYGANFGWIDWRGDTNNGGVIGQYVCSGYLYSANVGWIHLGNNAPTNGIQYQNLSAGDYGVNHVGGGDLRGLAYGANIGWINFENLGAPKVDLTTGKLGGSVYSANCGWISLSNAFAVVQTDILYPGADTDADGLPDAWEYSNFGSLSPTGGGDPDGDGMTNLQEYLAGTNPNDPSSLLLITAYSALPGGLPASLTWSSVMTRRYYIEKALSLNSPILWTDSGFGQISPAGSSTTQGLTDTNAPNRFYRVRAVLPLSP